MEKDKYRSITANLIIIYTKLTQDCLNW